MRWWTRFTPCAPYNRTSSRSASTSPWYSSSSHRSTRPRVRRTDSSVRICTWHSTPEALSTRSRSKKTSSNVNSVNAEAAELTAESCSCAKCQQATQVRALAKRTRVPCASRTTLIQPCSPKRYKHDKTWTNAARDVSCGAPAQNVRRTFEPVASKCRLHRAGRSRTRPSRDAHAMVQWRWFSQPPPRRSNDFAG